MSIDTDANPIIPTSPLSGEGSAIAAAIDAHLGSNSWQTGGGSMTGAQIVAALNTELGNSDWQAQITQAAVVAAVNAVLTNTDWQTQISGPDIVLALNGELGGTDWQAGNPVVSGAVSGTNIVLTLADGSTVGVDVSSLATDLKVASGAVSGGTMTLTLSDGSTVDVDVSGLLDNVQVASGALSGTDLVLTLNDSNTVTIDVAALFDGGTTIADWAASSSLDTGAPVSKTIAGANVVLRNAFQRTTEASFDVTEAGFLILIGQDIPGTHAAGEVIPTGFVINRHGQLYRATTVFSMDADLHADMANGNLEQLDASVGLEPWTGARYVFENEERRLSWLSANLVIRAIAGTETNATFDGAEAAKWLVVSQDKPGTWATGEIVPEGMTLRINDVVYYAPGTYTTDATADDDISNGDLVEWTKPRLNDSQDNAVVNTSEGLFAPKSVTQGLANYSGGISFNDPGNGATPTLNPNWGSPTKSRFDIDATNATNVGIINNPSNFPGEGAFTQISISVGANGTAHANGNFQIQWGDQFFDQAGNPMGLQTYGLKTYDVLTFEAILLGASTGEYNGHPIASGAQAFRLVSHAAAGGGASLTNVTKSIASNDVAVAIGERTKIDDGGAPVAGDTVTVPDLSGASAGDRLEVFNASGVDMVLVIDPANTVAGSPSTVVPDDTGFSVDVDADGALQVVGTGGATVSEALTSDVKVSGSVDLSTSNTWENVAGLEITPPAGRHLVISTVSTRADGADDSEIRVRLTEDGATFGTGAELVASRYANTGNGAADKNSGGTATLVEEVVTDGTKVYRTQALQNNDLTPRYVEAGSSLRYIQLPVATQIAPSSGGGIAEWDASEAYDQDDFVSFGPQLYVSMSNSNTNNSPIGNDGSNWLLIGAEYSDRYSIGADLFETYNGGWAEYTNNLPLAGNEVIEVTDTGTFDFNGDGNPITVTKAGSFLHNRSGTWVLDTVTDIQPSYIVRDKDGVRELWLDATIDNAAQNFPVPFKAGTTPRVCGAVGQPNVNIGIQSVTATTYLGQAHDGSGTAQPTAAADLYVVGETP